MLIVSVLPYLESVEGDKNQQTAYSQRTVEARSKIPKLTPKAHKITYVQCLIISFIRYSLVITYLTSNITSVISALAYLNLLKESKTSEQRIAKEVLKLKGAKSLD